MGWKLSLKHQSSSRLKYSGCYWLNGFVWWFMSMSLLLKVSRDVNQQPCISSQNCWYIYSYFPFWQWLNCQSKPLQQIVMLLYPGIYFDKVPQMNREKLLFRWCLCLIIHFLTRCCWSASKPLSLLSLSGCNVLFQGRHQKQLSGK